MTNEAESHLTLNPSSNASPAGGQDEFDDEAGLGDHSHSHHPHVYVMYWPEIATLKVGITEAGEGRWDQWLRRGAVLLMIGSTCCTEHARRIERVLLDVLAEYGARAFKNAEQARFALGRHKGGYTECYRLVQSPRFGEEPEHDYDYERAYGLILPAAFETTFHNCDLITLPITNAWRPA